MKVGKKIIRKGGYGQRKAEWVTEWFLFGPDTTPQKWLHCQMNEALFSGLWKFDFQLKAFRIKIHLSS